MAAQKQGPEPAGFEAEARESLAAARSALGWSRPVAATRAGVHRNTVLSWESNDETWGSRLNYLRVLLESDSAVARGIILRLLGLEQEDLMDDVEPTFLELVRAVYQQRDDPAVAQAIELLRTLTMPKGERDAATA